MPGVMLRINNSFRFSESKFNIIYKVKATLLKSHFGMGVVLYICCIFSEHFLLRTPIGGCFKSL